MADLNEDFFIEVEEKKDFLSLSFLSARSVFYINLNTIYNIEKTVNHCYCDCHLYSGCCLENGATDYCNLCIINNTSFSYFHEKRRDVSDIIKLHIELVNEFRKNKDIEIFTGDYIQYSRHPYTGIKTNISLYNYIYNTYFFKYDTFK